MENVNFEEVLQIVQSLPPEDRHRLREWLSKEAKQKGQANNGESTSGSFRQLETQWISEHRDEYFDQWVALDGDRLLSHGADLVKVYEEAYAQGVKFPFTAFIEGSIASNLV